MNTTMNLSLVPRSADRSRTLATAQAEWAKLRTLRATWLTIGISVAAAVALGALGSITDARAWDDMSVDERLTYDPTSTSLIGVLFGALVLGALGVRTITAEFSTGMIRTTSAAIPNRAQMLWTKVSVVAALTFAVALAANLAGFSIGQAALATAHIDVPLTSGESVAAIVLGAVAVSAFAVIGLGLGTIVRRASVANILIALVVIGGQILDSAIPSSGQRFLPFNALRATVTVERGPGVLHPPLAATILVGYALVAVISAATVLERRDV